MRLELAPPASTRETVLTEVFVARAMSMSVADMSFRRPGARRGTWLTGASYRNAAALFHSDTPSPTIPRPMSEAEPKKDDAPGEFDPEDFRMSLGDHLEEL